MYQLNSDQQLLQNSFDRLNIQAVWHFHAPVFTCADRDPVLDSLQGAHTKNLFLEDKNGSLWHIFMLQEGSVDLKALAVSVGAGRFSFAKPEKLLEQLHLTPGSVTPLGLMFATKPIKLIVDERMQEFDTYLMHGLSNDNTLAVSRSDFERWLQDLKIDFRYQEIPLR